jgi:hypothetical protein
MVKRMPITHGNMMLSILLLLVAVAGLVLAEAEAALEGIAQM